MIQKCQFNPVCDVEQVQPDGALDLAKAYALGSIPAGLESSDSDFNGIEDPASIAGKPADVFEGMQAGKVVEFRAKKLKDNKSAGKPADVFEGMQAGKVVEFPAKKPEDNK